MNEQLLAAVALSLLHGLIPSHWLPLLALSKKQQWDLSKTLVYTGLAGLAHAASTVAIGLGLIYGLAGTVSVLDQFSLSDSAWSKAWIWCLDRMGYLPALIVVTVGILFLVKHYKHRHFHVHGIDSDKRGWGFLMALMLAMFLSPCLEIEVYFLTLFTRFGMDAVIKLIVVYAASTILSMCSGVWVMYKGIERFDSHKIEHNAGMISGWVLVLSGLFMWPF
jgi:nickel/cobalt exporter